MSWRDHAKCKHDSKATSLHPDDIEHTKELCAQCPVTEECFKNAIDSPFFYVAAGVTLLDLLKMSWRRIDDRAESNFE